MFANQKPWDIDEILSQISGDMSETLRKNAEKDKNMTAVKKYFEEKRKKQEKYEEENYVTCPICGLRYNKRSESHYHLR